MTGRLKYKGPPLTTNAALMEAPLCAPQPPARSTQNLEFFVESVCVVAGHIFEGCCRFAFARQECSREDAHVHRQQQGCERKGIQRSSEMAGVSSLGRDQDSIPECGGDSGVDGSVVVVGTKLKPKTHTHQKNHPN